MNAPVCEACLTPENLTTTLWRAMTQLTDCLRCSKALCPNCFYLDMCETDGEPHEEVVDE